VLHTWGSYVRMEGEASWETVGRQLGDFSNVQESPGRFSAVARAAGQLFCDSGNNPAQAVRQRS
jgi:hypothetical protein